MTPNNSPIHNSSLRSNSLLGAIRGPVLLITLGVLVSVDFAGKVSFWRTWPVLMIVFGVLKLAEMVTHTRGEN